MVSPAAELEALPATAMRSLILRQGLARSPLLVGRGVFIECFCEHDLPGFNTRCAGFTGIPLISLVAFGTIITVHAVFACGTCIALGAYDLTQKYSRTVCVSDL